VSRRALRLVAPLLPEPRKTGVWAPLAAPIHADETVMRIRAQSLLCGIVYRDGRTSCPPLTLTQAIDVLAWHNPKETTV